MELLGVPAVEVEVEVTPSLDHLGHDRYTQAATVSLRCPNQSSMDYCRRWSLSSCLFLPLLPNNGKHKKARFL